ncbi:unnamed protein product [Strongylus vulgaris]|uniref:Uncharacterized protein n=1 Tax=Strongylus vulgaris TaxID=40348 RepID=A0A3P7JL54_STRVU|nr:unnamed protein product [Strongylus vulgaris]
MARRRRRSNGGKDDSSVKENSAKKRDVGNYSVEAVKEKSALSERNNPSSGDSEKADSPSTELCSPNQKIPESTSDDNDMKCGLRTSRKSSRSKCARSSEKKNSKAEKQEIEDVPDNTSDHVSEVHPAVTQNIEDNNDDVVCDSQEVVGSNPAEEEGDGGLIMEPEEILHLYERLTGDIRKPPEKSKDPLRDARLLRRQRLESLNQLKTLSLRLEDLNRTNSPMEKYLSFDDTAQRDALEIMNIRYEELCDDIFAADDEFLLMFEKEEVGVNKEDQVLIKPGPSICMETAANYVGVCMQSKLTVLI